MGKGIDIGNGYVKFDDKKFATRVKVGEKIGFGKQKKEIHYVEYENVKYIVGEGAIFTGDDRYFSKEYEICLLTAIALGAGKEDFIEESVVVGLPERKYKLLGEKLQKHIEKLGQKQIIVDGNEYTIRIKGALVFIESAYPILMAIEGNVIIIDNGAGTINVTQWEDLSIINSATYNEAMYKMYGAISSYLNTNKGSDFKPMDIEKILNKKTTVINQEEVDITDIRPIIQNHIKEIASYIKNDFDYKNAKSICLIGGGGADTIKYWEKEFPKIELVDNSQFINCKIYDSIAAEEFGDDGDGKEE
ncbi:ParM/StbA family protein [Clostridium botulinum]|uniref:Putative ATPase n=1 Tax=Clostridium botulinum CFSAN001627 TaxID=1232189 RepID=M1ZU77_CLOBO|nr:ParM/StbA family protein [Clostridium botulinum]EKN42946.1 putative ATPase [Clostridium botulinum CFSAN001627]APC82187.1 putative aTPase [Clostridium botulinum]AXG97803.1 ATPase [Clostridium botulinum]MBY6773548.1 ParM/StbA family protein [Clostridium botulinum]MBY6850422.1 ParM/StbA family protein [Clostridium botulinum]